MYKIIIFFCILLGCSVPLKNKNNCYKDISIFTLKGIDKLNNQTFETPCFCIGNDTLNRSKTISLCTKDGTEKIFYEYLGKNTWLNRKRFYESDEGVNKLVLEYIDTLKQTITMFEYSYITSSKDTIYTVLSKSVSKQIKNQNQEYLIVKRKEIFTENQTNNTSVNTNLKLSNLLRTDFDTIFINKQVIKIKSTVNYSDGLKIENDDSSTIKNISVKSYAWFHWGLGECEFLK